MTLPLEALEPRRLLSFAPIQLGTKGLDSVSETVVDAQGNTIVAGVFQHTITVGTAQVHIPETSGAVKLTAVGETDIFIVKYDRSGNVIWAGSIGGEESDLDKKPNFPIDPDRAGAFITELGPNPQTLGEYVGGLAADSDGNVFLGGEFLGQADLDPTVGTKIFPGNQKYGQYYDAFLIKLNADTGTLAWANEFGGQFNDVVNGIAVDPQGNPVITGYYTRRADFDPTNKGDFSVDALGREDVYVAKYTAAGGKLTWVDTFGGETTTPSDRDSGNDVAIDQNGNILVTGTFCDKVDFDPGPSVVRIKSVKRTDAFLLELSPRGKYVFVDTFGGKGYDGGVKVAARNGEIYTASYFTGEVDVDPGKRTQTLVSAGDDRHTDVLISKYDFKGGLIWAKPISGEGFETIGGFAVASDGSVYTSGGYFDSVDFDPGPGTDIITSTLGDDNFDDPNDNGRDNSYDIYVSRLSTNGKFLAATSIGSSGDDFGTALAVSADASTVTIGGQFRNTVAFAPASDSVKRKTKGSSDGFLAELSANLKLLT